MKPLLILAGVLTVALTPYIAQAGMFDFIGTTATAAAEYKLGSEIVQAVQASLGTLILLTCIIGAIVCMWAAAYIVIRLSDAARTAMQDNKITTVERVLLSILGVIAIGAGGMLGYFGLILLSAVRAGLTELLG